MRLLTKAIETKLQKQFSMGSSLDREPKPAREIRERLRGPGALFGQRVGV